MFNFSFTNLSLGFTLYRLRCQAIGCIKLLVNNRLSWRMVSLEIRMLTMIPRTPPPNRKLTRRLILAAAVVLSVLDSRRVQGITLL
jgi:hypothetical protein